MTVCMSLRSISRNPALIDAAVRRSRARCSRARCACCIRFTSRCVRFVWRMSGRARIYAQRQAVLVGRASSFSARPPGRDFIGDAGILPDDVDGGFANDLSVMRFEPFGVEGVGNGKLQGGDLVLSLEFERSDRREPGAERLCGDLIGNLGEAVLPRFFSYRRRHVNVDAGLKTAGVGCSILGIKTCPKPAFILEVGRPDCKEKLTTIFQQRMHGFAPLSTGYPQILSRIAVVADSAAQNAPRRSLERPIVRSFMA